METHPFPLIRAGGLFLAVVGLAVMLGAFSPRRRWLLLGAGGIVATILVTGLAMALTRPLGVPTRLQLACLMVAVVLEAVAIGWTARTMRRSSERTRTLAVLAIVGLHFVPMGPAFGPVVVLLGLAAAATAASGIWVFESVALRTWWALDGAMKFAAGLVMFLAAPTLAWW